MLTNSFRVYPKYLLMYKSSDKSRNIARYDISKERSSTKGTLSSQSVRKIKNAINNLCLVSDKKQLFDKEGNKFYFNLNFVTLTLPAMQGHTDFELKALLNDWLKGWEKKGLKNYVWKAEKQKNGNIHFHITTDHFIHYSDIRLSWNKQLARIGYISKYREVQQAWHKEGFRLRKNTIRYIRAKKVVWTREQQFKSWKEGKTSNWSNPNTTDVHACKNIKNIANYISEYMAKNKGDKVNGRLWGCSRNLLKKPDDLQGMDEIIVSRIFNDLTREDYQIKSEHYVIFPNRFLSPDELEYISPFIADFRRKLLAPTG